MNEESLRPNASSSKHSKVDRQNSAMEAQALSKKRKRQPVNGVRSAYGQRIQDAPVPPTMPASRPSSKPDFSRSSGFNFAVGIRTRAAARAEAAALEAATIESAAATNPAATPAATTSSAASSASAPTQQKRYRTRAASAAGTFENDEDVNTDAKVNKTAATVVVDKPTTTTAAPAPAPAPRPKPRTTLSAHKILTQALMRLCASAPAITERLNNRAPWSLSDTTDPPPRLRIRPLFDDVRSGRYGEVDVGDVNFSPLEPQQRERVEEGQHGQQEQQEKAKKKEEKKKRRDAALRRILDRVVRDTRDGTDSLANAGYFLQVLVEVQRCCVLREEAAAREAGGGGGGSGGGADAGGAVAVGTDDYYARLMEGVSLPWLVEAVFKMIVILVSWHRPLVPRAKDEEGKEVDEGCVLSTEQLVALVEGEIEEAVKLVEGWDD